MVRDDKETTVEKVLFSGKEKGLSFEKLDEKMQSWGRKKFGDKYTSLHSKCTVRKFTTCYARIMQGKQKGYSTRTVSGPLSGRSNAGKGKERSCSATSSPYARRRQQDKFKSRVCGEWLI